MKVIIPSAKLVLPELQNIGKIPAIIYPINQNISFDFFKLKYESMVSEIDIICFEEYKKIQDRLLNYKLETKLNLIKLDKLDDLGYSIYCGLNDDDGDIIIHFADTIIMDSLPMDIKDFFCYSEEYLNEMWTFYNMSYGQLKFINDKKIPSSSNIDESNKMNFFVGFFKISDGALFKTCLKKAQNESSVDMDSFYKALMLYSKINKLNSYKVKDWFDIGHSQKYFDARMQVGVRTFNHIDIDHNRGILKKTSQDIKKFIGEIKWYLKLPMNIEYVRPRIFNYSLSYTNPYIHMEYYSYRTLHELFVYGDLSSEQWEKIFYKIKFILDDFSKYKLKIDDVNDSLQLMYLDKTLKRLNKLKHQSEFINLFNKPITVNGILYKPLNEILDIIKIAIPKFLYNIEYFTIIHGDLCFPNMMIDDNFNFIKLIDPRGTFGKYDIYGDPRYEIAKLLHSIEGKYDFIIKDLFHIEVKSENNFKLNILESVRKFDLKSMFMKIFHDNIRDSINSIRLIEALLFLSMIPMHKESIEHQYAMLCTGVKLLNDVVDIGV